MDKYLLPYFFSNVRPTIFIATPKQNNQKNVIHNSNKSVYLPKSSVFLPVDVAGVDLCIKTTSISYLLRPTQYSSLIINSFKNFNFRPHNFNSGLSWPLRELIELFGLKGLRVQDSRNLLLDYSVSSNPLKKGFPCEGTEEVYFNFLDQKVKKFKIFFIEL